MTPNGNQTYLADEDGSATGRKTHIQFALDWSVNDYTFNAYYTAGGSAPTTGKALVSMRVRY